MKKYTSIYKKRTASKFSTHNISFIEKKYREYVKAGSDKKHLIFEQIQKEIRRIRVSDKTIFFEMSIIKSMVGEMSYIKNIDSLPGTWLANSLDNITQPYMHELMSKGWDYVDYSFYEYIKGTILRGQAKKEFEDLVRQKGLEENFWKYVMMIDSYISRIS